MKYVITDPQTNAVVATYEKRVEGWEFFEPAGRPYLAHEANSDSRTLIDAVIKEHQKKGRLVSVEP